ncbi:MAG: hypothetical protein A4E74_01950 [Syntrophus sp. PtaB.Bin075]|jgi:hypothetical protein|nr:MAG: hypothetical protein A4E74_01950 [Syntrophus sp. PtaB.Bin075]
MQTGIRVYGINRDYSRYSVGQGIVAAIRRERHNQWLQRLHRFGSLRASFRTSEHIASLRAYLRHGERLIEYSAAHIQHMQKALMQMNLQLHHVVSDITGATG